MFDKYVYRGLHFIMKYAGQLNAWAWREHVKILKRKQNIGSLKNSMVYFWKIDLVYILSKSM